MMEERRLKEHNMRAGSVPGLTRLSLGQRGLLVLAVCWLPPLLSCAGPVAVGPDHFGIGIYSTQYRTVGPGVGYRHIEGVGAIVINRRLSLGYIDDHTVCAAVRGRSYIAWTPQVTFAVGREATRVGTEFVFPNDVSLERSE